MTSSPGPQKHDTHGKALSINLDASVYGTLAEIGAGQEVARWFLSVGAASGTVATTISAYDKTVSDEIYGSGTRYVSKERLLAMLDHEYQLLLDRLGATRGKEKRFFVFADTVAARNYQGTNDQHGWLGIRFQIEPEAPPSTVLLHINLRDLTALLQQKAIGVLGVNLVYAALHERSDAATFLKGLFEELSTARIEIDVIEFSGPAFAGQDVNSWCLELLYQKIAHAIVFDSSAHVVEPSNVLRKRPMVVMRGSFAHSEFLDPDLLHSANEQLLAEGAPFERPPATVLEMTIRHVDRSETSSMAQMVDTIRRLAATSPVIVTDFPETHLFSRYLRRHTTEPVRFVMSIAALAQVLHEAFYRDLPGTLLEGIGRLLATNVKLYVSPMPREAFRAAVQDALAALPLKDSSSDLVSLDDLAPSGPGRHLFDYLRATDRIVALKQGAGYLRAPMAGSSTS
jgi:hypothetical protein